MILNRSTHSVRTLVVHTGGIGDFLLFCPALKRLAEEGPVELAGVDRDRLNLAVVSGIAEAAHLIDDFAFSSIFTGPSPLFQKYVTQFDRVIVWMTDGNGRIAGALRAAGVRDVRVLPGLPPIDWKQHASDYYASMLGLEGLPPLRMPFEEDGYTHDVLIHPGSGGKRKNWPLENFIDLAKELALRGRCVTWSLGPAESETKLPPNSTILTVPSIVTLARHLSGTAMFFGNDSGVTHLAAACGCKAVAIFGETNPAVWAPKGDNVKVASGNPWPSVSEVLRAIRE